MIFIYITVQTEFAPPAQRLYQHIKRGDDTDFISTSNEVLETIEPEAKRILGTYNLSINTDKTEKTVLTREETKEEETWDTTKKLGTLLGETEEMRRRKQLAACSFNNLWRIWSRKHNKINASKRLQLYNEYITPILTYNSCTWALTDVNMEELEILRRSQLRRIIGIQYPRKISNADLYKKCNIEELATTIRNARWRMLGHTLRMTDDTPAKHAMLHCFDKITKGFMGRPRVTLPLVINKDLKATQRETAQFGLPLQLKSISDLRQLETLARDHKKWKNVVQCVADMQVTEPQSPIIRVQPRRDAEQ